MFRFVSYLILLWQLSYYIFSTLSIFVDHESVANVCADLGTCYYNSGKYELAIATFEDGLQIVLLAETDQSLDVAEALYKIASCHDSLCNYDEGELFQYIFSFNLTEIYVNLSLPCDILQRWKNSMR